MDKDPGLCGSLDRYVLAIESTRIGLWDWNVQTGDAVFSERWAEICGYALAELEPVSIKTWEALVHPDDLRESAERLERCFSGETRWYELECRMRHKRGHWVWVHDRGMVTAWTEDGRPSRMTGTHSNITERKQLEMQERQSRENLHALFDTIKDFLFVVEQGGRILHANANATERLGYSLEELKQMHVLELHPELMRLQAATILESIRHGAADFCPIPLLLRNGGLVEVETRFSPGCWDGEPVLLGVSRDITVRKHAEERIARISEIQEQLMLLATAFVNVSVSRQDEAINAALSSIGKLIGSDRAYLIKYDFDAGTMDNTHEWCGQGIAPEIDNLQAVPMDHFPEWVAAHRSGKAYHVPDVRELPGGSNLRGILEPQGIKSLMTLPLIYGSACFGFVGFDAVNECRIWEKEEIGLLQVLAEMFANVESRRISEEMVARLNAEQAILIEEMRKLQGNLVHARDEAQAAAHAKGMFLANMSHEIRTPLNAVLGYAQILNRTSRDLLPEDDRTGLDVIIRSGQHLLHLVNDLLLLARAENQGVDLNKSAFDFHALVGNLKQAFRQKQHGGDLAIKTECLPGLPRILYSDAGKIRQVLINLLSNAVKFTQRGWIRISASVAAEEQAKPNGTDSVGRMATIAVRVADTGSGIPADRLERIFLAFEQATDERANTRGTGLGLAICRRFARALGGDITVESEPGTGSTFLFTFKANRVHGDFLKPERTVEALAPGQPTRRLLVAENDPASLGMIESMLQKVGFETEPACNGAEVLEILERDVSFDAVLLDKKMPKLDGEETLRCMRSMPGAKAIPVIVVTASVLDGEKERVLGLGADGFVPKPVQESLLLAEIERVAGVEFTYAGDGGREGRPVPPAGFEVGALACLPCELLDACRQALRSGRIHKLRALAAKIEMDSTPLAQHVRRLAERYDYEALENLFQAPREK